MLPEQLMMRLNKMKKLYTYFILICHTYYVRTGRFKPLDSALFCVTLSFGLLLISISVLSAKFFKVGVGKFILLSILLTFVFHILQKRTVKASFFSDYAKKNSTLTSRPDWQLMLIMIAPIIVILLFLLITLFELTPQ